MNGFYVTVSIPLLLVLAGFNHAHGLTTFGKSGGQQNNQENSGSCTNISYTWIGITLLTNIMKSFLISCLVFTLILHHASPRACTQQANCTLIKGTTCLRGFCLCGDNTNPVNGGCKAQYKGLRHICEKDEDCIDGADCVQKDKNKPASAVGPNDMICTCQEGLIPVQGACGNSRRPSTVRNKLWSLDLVVASLFGDFPQGFNISFFL